MTAARLAILLDLDGTLVDSEPGIRASCEAAIEALGHPSDGVTLAGMIGPPLEEIMTRLLARFGDDRVAEGVLAYRQHYGATGYRQTTLYPGIDAMLQRLAAMEVDLYVATSKRTVFARRILEHLGLAERFVAIHGSEPDGTVDHKADLIAHVLKCYGLDAGCCLMVGDRRHDVQGAAANGMAAAGVLWGYGERDELEAAGARYIIAQPAELVAIAEELNAARQAAAP